MRTAQNSKKEQGAKSMIQSFVDSLPVDPTITHSRVRTGSMIIAMYPDQKGKVHERKSYVIGPEQLSKEKHHRRLELMAMKAPLTPAVLAEYKSAVKADYNAFIQLSNTKGNVK